MVTIGIDIGGRAHVAARCRDGQTRADREILRVSQNRAGFAALDAWLERQPEPVALVTMESSGHYWMPLASHLRRREIPVAVVNPLAAKYFAKSRLARTKSDPADARSLAEMAMRDAPSTRDPLAGAELRQAARFAMTLVDRAGARSVSGSSAWSSSASRSSANCSTTRPAGRPARSCASPRPRGRRRGAGRRPWPTPTPDPGHRRLGRRRPSDSRPPRPTRSRCPSSTPRSPSRSACCSTSTTCSSARSRLPIGGSRACSTASSPGGSRRSRASARRSPRRSWPRSATSTGSRLRPAPRLRRRPPRRAELGPEGRRIPRPPGTCRRPATATSGRRPIGWPSWASSTTRSSPPTTHASERPARSKMNALGHCMRKALSLVWGVWRNGQDFDPDWGLEA